MRFYILTSRNLKALKRHFDPLYSGIPRDEAVVVINTLDEEYEDEASLWCFEQGIEYYTTPSNGTAATGKNFLLEIFLRSNDEHMAQIDGDDFLTPHGVWLYKHIAEQDEVPDAVFLRNQFSLHPFKGRQFLWQPNPWTKIIAGGMYFFKTNWEKCQTKPLFKDLVAAGVNPDKAMEFDREYKKYYQLERLYCEGDESHNRGTFLSRRAVELHPYPEEFAEDTLFYFLLKHEGLTGNLNVVCNDDRPPTYIYDQTYPGVIREEIKDGKDWSWMRVYNEQVMKMIDQGLMHEGEELPLLKVDYPPGYVPNILNLPLQRIPPANSNPYA